MVQYSQESTCARVFLSCNFIKKETVAQGFSSEFCKIFKNSFFTENTSGWLLLFYNSCWLYTLQLYIARSFEVVKKKTVSKKNSSICLIDFTDLDFFYTNLYF